MPQRTILCLPVLPPACARQWGSTIVEGAGGSVCACSCTRRVIHCLVGEENCRGAAGWKSHSDVAVASVTRRVKIEADASMPAGIYRERQKQLLEDLVCNPSEWWDNRLQKRSPGHPDFVHKATGEPLWLNNHDTRVVQGCRVMDSSDEFQSLFEEGQMERMLDVLARMEKQGSFLSLSAYSSLLKACAKRKALTLARRLHAHLSKHGLEACNILGESLVSTLVNCGGLEDALVVFYKLRHRTAFSWTAVITGYSTTGQVWEALRMYECMQKEGVEPSKYTFVSLLRACGSLSDLTEGRRIHAEVLRYGCEADQFVSTCLVDMYGKCGSIVDAEIVFEGLVCRDVVSWNAMLAAYVEHGHAKEALRLYRQMQEAGMTSDVRTVVSTLRACSILAEMEKTVFVGGRFTKVQYIQHGKALHAEAKRKGFDTDAFVGSTLVGLYGRCGSLVDAQIVFDGLAQQNVVLWTVMLASYAQQGQAHKALEVYEDMQEVGVTPNDRTFVTVLQAWCLIAEEEEDGVVDGKRTKVKSLEKGKAIHAEAQRRGCDTDLYVGKSLVTMYGKCGSILDAQIVFESLSLRDVVAWTAMLSAYVEQGQAEKALQHFSRMQEQGVSPDEITLVAMVQACGDMGQLDICRQVHHALLSSGSNLSLLLGNTLIHAYGRCASMPDACTVFDALPHPDVVSWTALIAGYARQGNCAASIQLYEDMRMTGLKPNGITFLSLLSACSHAGLVDKGVEYFESMGKDYGIAPETEHYVCMVDLLGRAGFLTSMDRLVSTMPFQPNAAIWLCLLSACRKHGKVVLGKKAFDHIISQQPGHAASYILMSNIYAHAGLFDQEVEVNELKQKAGAWKKPGQTWIEHEQEIHSFVVGNREHPQHERLYDLVTKVSLDLEEEQRGLPGCRC